MCSISERKYERRRKGNPALRLYERLGFKIIDENEEGYIMLLFLK